MNRPQPTLADFLAIAISPVLIMALVGSLVFFLLEVLYVGQYGGRLQWILFFFVFAAVLIARMSIEGLTDRAGLYGVVLAVLVWIGLQQLVEYSPDVPLAAQRGTINVLLMGVIWWCAHRLTWDCTLIDDKVEASGAGLLQAAGLEGQGSREEPTDLPAESRGRRPHTGLLGWWERYARYRDANKRRPRNPGVWVVYFSLAALPLFGLGQSLIDSAEVGRRRYVFWLMSVYVASGLGLLLTTSFLGLRRYVRQRKLQMPPAMTATWLVVGGAMIVVLLVAGALLPRPNAEYPLVHLGPLARSPERSASRWAMKEQGTARGESRSASDQTGGTESKPGSGAQPGNEGQADGGARSNRESATGPSVDKPGEKPGPAAGPDGPTSEASRQPSSTNDTGQREKNPSKAKARETEGEKPADSGTQGRFVPGKALAASVTALLGKVGKVLKWVVFGVTALVVAFLLLRALLRFLANFTWWARHLLAALNAWWQGLGRRKGHDAADQATEAAPGTHRKPFAAFRNPFWDDADRGRSPEWLVRHTFEALEALAWERGHGRRADETPLEFAQRLGEEFPALEAEARRLVGLYVRLAYAGGSLPAGCPAIVRQVWQHLEQFVEAPLST